MAVPTHIQKFSVIPISYGNSTTHYLYARQNVDSKGASSPLLPSGRTLFLVNVPPDATEREISMFFKHSGTVEKVIFDFDLTEPFMEGEDSDAEAECDDEMNVEEEDAADGTTKKRTGKGKPAAPTVVPLPTQPLRKLRQTGRSAHVVFLDESSLERALASTSKPRAWPSSAEEPRGLAHYRSLRKSLRPPLDAVQTFSNTFMEVYEYEQEKKKQQSKYKKGEAIVDDDGFTLVTRGGAYGKTLGGGVGVASKRFQRTGESRRNRGQKKERKEKEGFYGFQKAEKQRSELLELKRKWEEDKAKVEKLKASRRFKPY